MNAKNMMIGIAIGSAVLLALQNEEEPPPPVATKAIGTPAKVTGALDSSPAVTEVKDSHAETRQLAGRSPAAAAPAFEFDEQPGLLRQLLKESIAEAKVTTATAEELKLFEEQFLNTLKQRSAWYQLAASWAQLGWNLQGWTAKGKRFVAICESSDQRRGRGIYVIQVDSPSRIALQAPHRFFDTQTGLLTRKLFAENNVLAAAWNTVHRREVDLAHQSNHFINAMTRALLRFDSQIVVAQIHGFGNEKHETAARSASMIVSDTTRYPGRLVRRAAEQQKAIFGAGAVRLYPTEVAELGGTQNQQARVFHNMGRTGFLHIELDRQLRQKLTNDASVRSQFFSALTSSTANRQDLRDR